MVHTKVRPILSCHCYIMNDSLIMISLYEVPDRALYFKSLPNLQNFRMTEISLENLFCLSAMGQTVPILVSPLTFGPGRWMKVTWLLRLHTAVTNVPQGREWTKDGTSTAVLPGDILVPWWWHSLIINLDAWNSSSRRKENTSMLLQIINKASYEIC